MTSGTRTTVDSARRVSTPASIRSGSASNLSTRPVPPKTARRWGTQANRRGRSFGCEPVDGVGPQVRQAGIEREPRDGHPAHIDCGGVNRARPNPGRRVWSTLAPTATPNGDHDIEFPAADLEAVVNEQRATDLMFEVADLSRTDRCRARRLHQRANPVRVGQRQMAERSVGPEAERRPSGVRR